MVAGPHFPNESQLIHLKKIKTEFYEYTATVQSFGIFNRSKIFIKNEVRILGGPNIPVS